MPGDVKTIEELELDTGQKILIFSLRKLQTTCYECKITLYFLFIDSQQAYDKINRKNQINNVYIR